MSDTTRDTAVFGCSEIHRAGARDAVEALCSSADTETIYACWEDLFGNTSCGDTEVIR